MADVLSTGLRELDAILSGEGGLRRGELSVFVAMPPTYKTELWRRQLEHAMKNDGTAAFIDYEMKPTASLSDMGAKPPDDPITS